MPLGSISTKLNWFGLPVVAWLSVIVLLPNALLFATSFLSNSEAGFILSPSLANYQRIWASNGFWVLLGRTLIYSFTACLLATVIAYPLAYYVGRMVRKYRTLLTVLIILPLWISLLMRIFAWRIILGQGGVLNTALVSSGILDHPSSAFLYSPSSVVLVFAYISVPYIFLSTMGAFEKIPDDLIEASEDSGASKFQTFLNVVWPLTRRNLAVGFALAFLVTVGDFVTPAMIGGIDGTTLGVVISTQFGFANNWPYGSAVAVALMACATLISAMVIIIAPSRGVLIGDGGGRSHVAESGKIGLGRSMGAAGFSLAILYLYTPLAIIFLFSLNSANLQTFPLQGLTLDWYRKLFEDQSLLEAVRRSLIVAVSVVSISVVVGTAFALIIHYTKLRGAKYFELAFALPIATPGVVLGIQMVLGTALFGVPSGIGRIVIGQMSFVMPVTMLLLLVQLRRLDPSLVEASLDSGANHWKTFVYVLLPMIKRSLIAGAFLGLTLSADDVMVTLFLSGGEPTLPIWVFNQMRFGFTPSVNAVFAILTFGVLAMVAMGWFAEARKSSYQ